MKDYTLSIFNSGLSSILVSTAALLSNLENREIGKGRFVKRGFKGLSNIVLFGLDESVRA